MTTQQTTQMIPVGSIVPSKTNPRKHFDEFKLKELAASIKEHGQLQAILVCKLEDGTFEIIAGERRWRASKIAGRDVMKCEIVELDEKAKLEVQIIENVMRDDLHPMEEAQGYKHLIDDHNYTTDSIATKTGKSKSYVVQRLQLLHLTPEAQQAFSEEKFQLGHALIIARIEDEKVQNRILKELTGYKKYTTQELQDYITRNVFVSLANASFKIIDAELIPEVGACTTCQYNTDTNTGLFPDMKKAGMCANPSCFNDKTKANWKQITTSEEAKGNIVLSMTEGRKLFQAWDPKRLATRAYVFCNSVCEEHPKKSTYKTLVGKKCKEYVVMDRTDTIRRLYKSSDVVDALKDETWAKKEQKKAVAHQEQSSADQKREQRRDEILKDILTPVIEKYLNANKTEDQLMDIIQKSSPTIYGSSIRLLGVDVKEEGFIHNSFAKYIRPAYDKLKTSQQKLNFIYKVIAVSRTTHYNEIGKADFIGIDTKEYVREARKKESAEWRATLTATPKKTAKKVTTKPVTKKKGK